MSGGVAALRLRQRRPARPLLRRLADRRHRERPERGAQRALPQPRRQRFEDVTDKAGVGHPGWGMGVCTADVDGDGWRGPLRHRPRRRTGSTATTATARFTDIAPQAGVTAAAAGRPAARFADYDRDGDLDLFVSRYVKLDLAAPAGVRQGQDVRVPRRRRAVRAARACPARATCSSATKATGRSSRWARRPASSDPRGYFGLGVGLVRLQRRRLARPLRGQRLERRTSST